MSKVILISIIGDRDPFWLDTKSGARIMGPVRGYVETVLNDEQWSDIRPDHAYLLYTEGSGQNPRERYEELASELHLNGITTTPCPIKVQDPTDFDVLLREMGAAVRRVSLPHKADRLTVLMSPGTGQMQAVWIALANDGRLKADLYQKKEERFGGEVRPVLYEPLFEGELLRLALEMFKRYDFEGARQLFLDVPNWAMNSFRRRFSPTVADLCSFLMLWDNRDFKMARNQLNHLKAIFSAPVPNSTSLSAAYNEVSGFIADFDTYLTYLETDQTQAIVLDLLVSSSRYFQTGKYIDSLWRSRTTYEVMLRHTLEKEGRSLVLEDENIPFMELRLQDATAKLRRRQASAAPGSRRCYDTWSGGHAGMIEIANDQALHQAIIQIGTWRNASLHLGKGISDVEAETAWNTTVDAIQRFFKGDPLLLQPTQHPMSPTRLTSLHSILSTQFEKRA